MKFLLSIILSCSLILGVSCTGKTTSSNIDAKTSEDSIPTVYYIKDITPENLVKVYEALGRKAEGKKSESRSPQENRISPIILTPL